MSSPDTNLLAVSPDGTRRAAPGAARGRVHLDTLHALARRSGPERHAAWSNLRAEHGDARVVGLAVAWAAELETTRGGLRPDLERAVDAPCVVGDHGAASDLVWHAVAARAFLEIGASLLLSRRLFDALRRADVALAPMGAQLDLLDDAQYLLAIGGAAADARTWWGARAAEIVALALDTLREVLDRPHRVARHRSPRPAPDPRSSGPLLEALRRSRQAASPGELSRRRCWEVESHERSTYVPPASRARAKPAQAATVLHLRRELPRPGDRVQGRYDLVREVGAGGAGVVFEGRDITNGRPVALKFPRRVRGSGAPELEIEATLVQRLRSPHVLQSTFARSEDLPYLVMDYLEGDDLGTMLAKDGPLPVPVAVGFLLQACDAVRDAHEAQVVHHDLKPANLFCTRRADGRPFIKVCDFGTARLLDGSTPRGDVRERLVGTLPYMAPEQIDDPAAAGPAADVWALAVTLYELLTGQRPFVEETPRALVEAISRARPRPLRLHHPSVEPGLELLIRSCLEKDPSRRPSVRALAVSLERWRPVERRSRARVWLHGVLEARGGGSARASPSREAGSLPAARSERPAARTMGDGAPPLRPRGRLATVGSVLLLLVLFAIPAPWVRLEWGGDGDPS